MEKIKTPILFIVTVFTVAFLWAFISTNSYRSKAALGEVLVYFGTQTVNGNDITLPVTIESEVTQKVSSATVNISYDKTKVQFVSVDHTGCSSLNTPFDAKDSATTGVVSETKVRMDNTLPSGAFCFANYKFTAIGSGDAVFSINTTTSQVVGPGPISYTIKTNANSTKTIAVNNNNPNAQVSFETGTISVDKKSVLLPVTIKTDADKNVSSAKITLQYDKTKINYSSVDPTACDSLNTALEPKNSSSEGKVSQTKVRLDNTLPSGTFCFTKFNFGALTGVNGTATISILKTESEIVGPGPTSFNVVVGAGSAVNLTIENGLIVGIAIPTISPTTVLSGTPIPGNVTLDLKLKFQGVVKKPASGQESIQVKVKLVSADGTNKSEGSGKFAADDKGVWTGTVGLNAVPGSSYKVFVKGPKHLQKRVCDGTPTETYPGTYHCDQGNINIAGGQNTFDFSGIYMLVGDLPDQDGVVNSYDTSLVRNNLGKSDASILTKADLNFDGIVDTQDYSLIISALSVRGDEGE